MGRAKFVFLIVAIYGWTALTIAMVTIVAWHIVAPDYLLWIPQDRIGGAATMALVSLVGQFMFMAKVQRSLDG